MDVEKRRQKIEKDKQRAANAKWDKFGGIVQKYLGIPYKRGKKGQKRGYAIRRHTGKRHGIATREAGLMCTSFVDVVMSHYLYDTGDRQLALGKGYGFHKLKQPKGDIFHALGLRLLKDKVEPAQLENLGLRKDRVYGVVFHTKEPWTEKKHGGKITKITRTHVGFLAFDNGKLFLIHAGGKKGVHIIAWKRFLDKGGRPDLKKWGTRQPKHLSIYHIPPAPVRRT